MRKHPEGSDDTLLPHLSVKSVCWIVGFPLLLRKSTMCTLASIAQIPICRARTSHRGQVQKSQNLVISSELAFDLAGSNATKLLGEALSYPSPEEVKGQPEPWIILGSEMLYSEP